MRRRLWIVAVTAVLAALLASVPVAATTFQIPGTPISVVELEDPSQVVAFGSSANFSWGVYNGGLA